MPLFIIARYFSVEATPDEDVDPEDMLSLTELLVIESRWSGEISMSVARTVEGDVMVLLADVGVTALRSFAIGQLPDLIDAMRTDPHTLLPRVIDEPEELIRVLPRTYLATSIEELQGIVHALSGLRPCHEHIARTDLLDARSRSPMHDF